MAYIWRGDLTDGFLRYQFGGLIFGGAYTWRGSFLEFYGTSCRALWPLSEGKSSPKRLIFSRACPNTNISRQCDVLIGSQKVSTCLGNAHLEQTK